MSPYRPGREALSNTVEVSYGVDESMQHRGIGTAMLQEILRVATKLGRRIVIAIIFDNNIPSRRLLEKCAFQRWGHLPDVAQMDGAYIGHHYYGLKLV